MKALRNNNRIIASVEARMGSSRLPGKVLMDICGKPAIIRLLERLQKCRYIDDIIVATTTETQDDPLTQCVINAGFKVFRGSETDVLSRVVSANKLMNSDIIVEITGDCPLVDPEIVDLGISTFLNNSCDVVSNTYKLSFPQGVDVQVFLLSDLAWVDNNIKDPAVREHVSLYFYENENKYKLIHLQAPHCWEKPNLRFQLDYHDDLKFIRAVYQRLIPQYSEGFGLNEILSLLEKEPSLIGINNACVEKDPRG